MNHLNSVLVEGFIVENPEYSEGEKLCTFKIESYRYVRVNGEIVKKVNVFSVIVPGKIGEECATKKKGTCLRIVGRLDAAEGNAVTIEAESIEYKPAMSGKGA